ncbi:hypothetical protein ANO11243_046640 [Dothideomycetidae sp. 11243]|nr:hypothetical protein ANO11243_046640 [fungal sp. No.11243]
MSVGDQEQCHAPFYRRTFHLIKSARLGLRCGVSPCTQVMKLQSSGGRKRTALRRARPACVPPYSPAAYSIPLLPPHCTRSIFTSTPFSRPNSKANAQTVVLQHVTISLLTPAAPTPPPNVPNQKTCPGRRYRSLQNNNKILLHTNTQTHGSHLLRGHSGINRLAYTGRRSPGGNSEI